MISATQATFQASAVEKNWFIDLIDYDYSHNGQHPSV